jgi:hypothetical protein
LDEVFDAKERTEPWTEHRRDREQNHSTWFNTDICHIHTSQNMLQSDSSIVFRFVKKYFIASKPATVSVDIQQGMNYS